MATYLADSMNTLASLNGFQHPWFSRILVKMWCQHMPPNFRVNGFIQKLSFMAVACILSLPTLTLNEQPSFISIDAVQDWQRQLLFLSYLHFE